MTIHPLFQQFSKAVPKIVLMSFFILTGCSDDPKSAIIGGWEGITLKQDFHFYADGQAELNDRKHGIYNGTCTISDKDKLTCNFDRFAYPIVRTVQISGNKLYLKNKNGQEEAYLRK